MFASVRYSDLGGHKKDELDRVYKAIQENCYSGHGADLESLIIPGRKLWATCDRIKDFI